MPNKRETLIFFVHRGSIPLYLQAAILQALDSNPQASVILLCDSGYVPEALATHRRFQPVSISAYSSRARKFEQVYSHHGKNPYLYTLGNLQRWFLISEFADQHATRRALLHLDSDSFLYAPARNITDTLSSGMTVCSEIGPQFTFFRNPSALKGYVAFLESSFSSRAKLEKIQDFVDRRQDFGLPHISDMATIGYYAKLKKLTDLGKWHPDQTGYFFDENIGLSQGMKLGLLGKKIVTRKGEKYFLPKPGGFVLAGGVHLQGGNKVLWPFFVTSSVHLTLIRSAPIDYLFAIVQALAKCAMLVWLRIGTIVRRAVGMFGSRWR